MVWVIQVPGGISLVGDDEPRDYGSFPLRTVYAAAYDENPKILDHWDWPNIPSPALTLGEAEASVNPPAPPPEVLAAVLPCGHRFLNWDFEVGGYATIYRCAQGHEFVQKQGAYVPLEGLGMKSP